MDDNGLISLIHAWSTIQECNNRNMDSGFQSELILSVSTKCCASMDSGEPPLSFWCKTKSKSCCHFCITFFFSLLQDSRSSDASFTLRLCLYAASSTAGTKSSAGSPLSSARPGGYQESTRTPGDTWTEKQERDHPSWSKDND